MARTKKPFAIILLGFVVSIVVGFLIFGNIFIALFNFSLFLLADLIHSKLGFQTFKNSVLSYMVASLWCFGEIGSYWFFPEWMLQKSVESGLEADFIQQVLDISNTTSLGIAVITTFICGFISAMISKSMFQKHFSRAGLIEC